MMINSTTELYCIFGSPVKHSLSPVMQNSAFHYHKKNSVYLAFEPTSIEEGVNSMRSLNIKGASVTIPFKIDVMKHIDNLDYLAEKIGSVNTLKNNNGIITGFNTDGYGALLAIENSFGSVKNKNILIIGNGGSARAIGFTLLNEGGHITITGRNIKKISSLAEDLDNSSCITLKELTPDYMQDVDIVINTTPVGMSPDADSIPINENLIQKKHIVFDIIYSPDKTKLLSISEDKGAKIIYGINMLLFQGIKQFAIWTGLKAPEEVMRSSLKKALSKKR